MKSLLTLSISLAVASVAAAQGITVNRAGSQPAQDGPTANFVGKVRMERLFAADAPARTTGGLVTFEAGARTAWHTHPLGQTLIVTEGVGHVQHWGGPVKEIRKGDTVRIPPNVKHWHGASPQSAMTHIAIGEHLDGKTVDWMEQVSDSDFNAPVPGQPVAAGTSGPSRAQQLVGDVAPKLAELTDTVLFADVWARPQLARRDRSLVTVSALVPINSGRTSHSRSRMASPRKSWSRSSLTSLSTPAGRAR